MLNPASIIKIKNAKNKFAQNHPKVIKFFNAIYEKGIEEGTVMEITVKKPGQKAMTANFKVQQSDLELLQEQQQLVK